MSLKNNILSLANSKGYISLNDISELCAFKYKISNAERRCRELVSVGLLKPHQPGQAIIGYFRTNFEWNLENTKSACKNYINNKHLGNNQLGDTSHFKQSEPEKDNNKYCPKCRCQLQENKLFKNYLKCPRCGHVEKI